MNDIMNYIYTVDKLKRVIEEIIPTLPQKIPYINDREDIFKKLFLDYDVQINFKKVYSIVTSYCIR